MAEFLLPPIEQLRELFSYDPNVGSVTWKTRPLSSFASPSAGKTWNAKHAGARGSLNPKSGHRVFRLTVNGVEIKLLAHRLAWALHYGVSRFPELDHRNRNGQDNRICNLRPASRSNNNANRGTWTKTGLPKGVTKVGARYSALASAGDGRTEYLGTHDTPQQAHKAFCAFVKERHGEFANTGD